MNTKNNNCSITVSFRQLCTIISQYSAEYCFENLYVLDYFVRLLIFRQGIVCERTIFISFSLWYWTDSVPSKPLYVVVYLLLCSPVWAVWHCVIWTADMPLTHSELFRWPRSSFTFTPVLMLSYLLTYLTYLLFEWWNIFPWCFESVGWA